MITETLQRITCFISTKIEIPRDHAAPGGPAPHAGPRMALTRHLSHG
jgi:hypothetical protein